MQRKINLTRWFVYKSGKQTRQKPPSSDFKVTTPEIPQLSQHAITSKGIPVPYINLQLNPFSNTQLDLFYSDNFPFWCTALKYVTNQLRGSQYATLITNWRRLLAAKLFSSSTMKIKKMLGYKTQQCTNTATFHKNDEFGQILSPGHNLLEQTFLNTCATCEHYEGP